MVRSDFKYLHNFIQRIIQISHFHHLGSFCVKQWFFKRNWNLIRLSVLRSVLNLRIWFLIEPLATRIERIFQLIFSLIKHLSKRRKVLFVSLIDENICVFCRFIDFKQLWSRWSYKLFVTPSKKLRVIHFWN